MNEYLKKDQVDIEMARELTKRFAQIGKNQKIKHTIEEVEIFRYYLNNEGQVKEDELDFLDGGKKRREILARFLLLNSVLDQGPDMEGVRLLLVKIVNQLYRKEVRIFHRPLDFFKEIGISIDNIKNTHDIVKELRAAEWARKMNSSPGRYNLYMDNTKQVLNYALFRWGVPLGLTLLLEKEGKELIEYLEIWKSAELMSRALKNDIKYGLGKAIGPKACHLFTKWFVESFGLSTREDKGWSYISYEPPFDSNAGRVLFRTGWLFLWAYLENYKDWNVIQEGKGKGGTDYIRVTNIRGNKVMKKLDKGFFNEYKEVVINFLKTKTRTSIAEIQQMPCAILKDENLTVANFDDGLMYIGTKYCFNLENPNCKNCPVNDLCEGYNKNKSLILDYRT